MRLGEVKSLLDVVVDADNEIVLEAEPIFGGQAYQVEDYSDLIKALDSLHQQAWNSIDYSQVELIKKKYNISLSEVQITAAEYNELNAYINAVNKNVPIFLGMLDTLVDEQNEQIINIKLPKRLTSFTSLNKLNSSLERLFKMYTIDGEVKFQGFDRGSDWYIVLLTGTTTYSIFISSLKLAQEYFKTRTEYFNSKKAELDYRASLADTTKFSPKEFEAYENKRLDLELEEKVREVLKETHDQNGHTDDELQSKVLAATKELVKELGEGVEFHLSLNPPSYAREKAGKLIIDYKKIREIVTTSEQKSASIESGEKKTTDQNK